jgi:rod shape-determining protein MreD
VALQVLLLNKIHLRWWTTPNGFPIFVPYLYPLFLLLLPFELSVVAMLILGFVLGLTIDMFMNTTGMHAAACVLMAYLRTNALSALLPKHLSEYAHQSPSVKTMGWVPFLTYCAFLLVIHHALYFTLELWNFTNPGIILLKILASALTSMLMILVFTLLFTRQGLPRNN